MKHLPKKLFLLSAFIGLLTLISPYNSFAQTGTPPQEPRPRPTATDLKQRALEAQNKNQAAREGALENRQEKREQIGNKIEDKREQLGDKKEQMGEKREELKEKMAEKRGEMREKAEERIKKHGELMSKRFQATIERLEKLVTRIESRIAKISSEGGTTSEAKTHVANAKAKITSAKANIAKLPASLETALGQENLKGSFEESKSLAQAIKEDLKSAHAELVKAITQLKGLRKETAPTSTPAQESTNVQSVQ